MLGVSTASDVGMPIWVGPRPVIDFEVSTASDVGMPVWDNRNVSPLPELIVDLHVHMFFQDSTHQTLNFLTDPDTNYTIMKQMLEDNYTGLMAALWDADLVE